MEFGSADPVERPFNIAIYGDVNLNFVDGSAVWLASLVESLHQDNRVRQHVFLKAPIHRDILTSRIADLDRTQIISPGAAHANRPLTPEQVLDVIEMHDDRHRFDAVVLRGFRVCRLAARRQILFGRIWPYLTDIPQRLSDVSDEDQQQLAEIADASRFILCQTEEFRSFLEVLLPNSLRKLHLLPPMVPDDAFRPPRSANTAEPPRLLYAGKFAPSWAFLEMVDAFVRVRRHIPNLEFHVAGDKIHNPPDEPAYARQVQHALEATEGLIWHRAITRQGVLELAAESDLAMSPRRPELDKSLELSTKVLEYGATRTSVVLNRNPLHERILGSDYPFFVDSTDDIARVIESALLDEDARFDAADRCYRAALTHSYASTLDRIRPLFDRVAPRRIVANGAPSHVLVAGHDLKFFGGVEEALVGAGFDVRHDIWTGHQTHNEHKSLAALKWADIILCEWCLGNAVWYSRYHRLDQKMLVRLHRVELDTPYPEEVAIDRVHRVVTVSPLYKRLTAQLTGWPDEVLTIIPNGVDCLSADRPKLPGAQFNLGMVGWVPQLKRLDRALDLLEYLRGLDPRYRLILKGALPWEVDWIWDDASQRSYFIRQLTRIHATDALRSSVSIDPFGTNVYSWLRKVGHILSPSELESFHLGLAEGMASRAVPVIWDRPGAASLYSDRWIRHGLHEAADAIVRLSGPVDSLAEGNRARVYINERYCVERVQDMWLSLVADMVTSNRMDNDCSQLEVT